MPAAFICGRHCHIGPRVSLRATWCAALKTVILEKVQEFKWQGCSGSPSPRLASLPAPPNCNRAWALWGMESGMSEQGRNAMGRAPWCWAVSWRDPLMCPVTPARQLITRLTRHWYGERLQDHWNPQASSRGLGGPPSHWSAFPGLG